MPSPTREVSTGPRSLGGSNVESAAGWYGFRPGVASGPLNDGLKIGGKFIESGGAWRCHTNTAHVAIRGPVDHEQTARSPVTPFHIATPIRTLRGINPGDWASKRHLTLGVRRAHHTKLVMRDHHAAQSVTITCRSLDSSRNCSTSVTSISASTASLRLAEAVRSTMEAFNWVIWSIWLTAPLTS